MSTGSSTSVNKGFIKHYRWYVCALLFYATTLRYVDRQVIGILKPTLERYFDWSEIDYSNVVIAFSASYAIGLIGFGRLVDKIGTKLGYTISLVVWSLASMAHALAKGTFGFGLARAALGLSEGGNFPTAIKTVAEWFPKKERALATGIFISGTNIGAIVAPIIIPIILAMYGWQEVFIVTGIFGFVWLILWRRFYNIPALQKRLSKEEFDYIHSDEDENHGNKEKVSWFRLLALKQTWAFIVGKFLTDPIWWFFLFWLPSYFVTTFGVDFTKPSLLLVIIYTATSIGSIGGGYLSSRLIQRGWSAFKARRVSMLIFAFCVTPIMFAQSFSSLWVAVAIISLAAASHQAWSTNILTTTSDIFPKKVISSIVGIGTMAGAVGSILFPLFIGRVLQYYKELGDIGTGYSVLFVICGGAYLAAFMVMHLLTPKHVSLKI